MLKLEQNIAELLSCEKEKCKEQTYVSKNVWICNAIITTTMAKVPSYNPKTPWI